MTFEDRLRSVLIGGVAIVIAFFMLYYRLPDAISSSIVRSAHDFYVNEKQMNLSMRKDQKSSLELEDLDV